jgi:2-methylene-furan-3-one reductase
MVRKPCIPESDVAGVIVAIGSDVTNWKIGDEVYGVIPTQEIIKTGQGGLAEYALVQQDYLYLHSTHS